MPIIHIYGVAGLDSSHRKDNEDKERVFSSFLVLEKVKRNKKSTKWIKWHGKRVVNVLDGDFEKPMFAMAIMRIPMFAMVKTQISWYLYCLFRRIRRCEELKASTTIRNKHDENATTFMFTACCRAWWSLIIKRSNHK